MLKTRGEHAPGIVQSESGVGAKCVLSLPVNARENNTQVAEMFPFRLPCPKLERAKLCPSPASWTRDKKVSKKVHNPWLGAVLDIFFVVVLVLVYVRDEGVCGREAFFFCCFHFGIDGEGIDEKRLPVLRKTP